MKQGTKRLLSMGLSLALIVGAFVIFFEFIQPAYAELQVVQGKRRGKEALLNEQKEAVKHVQDLIQTYGGDSAAQLKQDLSNSLPLGPDLSSALVQLEGLVRASGLNLQSLAPQQVKGKAVASPGGLVKPVGTLGFKLAFTGNYEALKSFFSKLENNVMIFEVRKIGIQPAGRGQTDFYTINLEVASFYQNL